MFGLTLLSPWFLLGLAAAAGPLILHLFARENAPVATLPTMRFVPKAPVQQTRRRKLQDVLLLLLRILAITLLTLGFARPFFARPVAMAQPSLGIVAIDTSFSMAGPEREQAIRRVARQAFDEMGGAAQVALMVFDQEARLIVAPSASRRDVTAAIDRVATGYGSTNYSTALRAAVDVAKQLPSQLVIITDGQRAGVDVEALPAVPATLDVSMRTIAAAVENLSIDAMNRSGDELVALVHNHGRAERRTRIRWSLDGAETSSELMTVPAGGALEARWDRPLPGRGVITAVIDDEAGYAADNSRYFVADPARPTPVLIVNSIDGGRESGLYVRAALDAAGANAPFAVTEVVANDKRLSSADSLNSFRAIIVVGTRGLDRGARQAVVNAVRGGRGLLVAAGPDVEPGVVRELLGGDVGELGEVTSTTVKAQGLVATEARHPVLAALGDTVGNLGQVRIDRTWAIRDLPGSTTLLRLSSGQPALSEIPVGQGRAFLLTSDVGRRWNTWPLHPTFVPFLVESVRHLGGQRTHDQNVLVGALDTPDASRPGVVTSPLTSERVAVNVDPRESRLETLLAREFSAGLERTTPPNQRVPAQRDVEQGQNLWRYAMFLLLGVLVTEGLVASRARVQSGTSSTEPHGEDLNPGGERT